MATSYPTSSEVGQEPVRRLADPRFAIGGPRFDMLCFWGAPLIALVAVLAYVTAASLLPQDLRDVTIGGLFAGIAILTFAHLIAVVPRAYLNTEVLHSNLRRLTIVPVVLIAALVASPTLMVLAGMVAFFWDVHHSAMQTFGISRIYDMKAGNGPLELRSTDLRLNWVLYVGPIAAGASLASHLGHLNDLKQLDWAAINAIPGVIQGHSSVIRWLAIGAWLGIAAWAARDYAAAARRGYKLPAHKAALLGSTALVSILTWGLAPPIIAFAVINLFHAVQYFALVWLKEGARIQQRTARLLPAGRLAQASAPVALFVFLLLCTSFGVAYYTVQDTRMLIAPFIACSLLHFWFDSFVWSVRKKQV